MDYRKEVIDLFDKWHAEHPAASILFKGYPEGLPARIYVYNYASNKDFCDLNESYVRLLQRLYGEFFIYGEELPYAVEFIDFKSTSDDPVTKAWIGTLEREWDEYVKNHKGGIVCEI